MIKFRPFGPKLGDDGSSELFGLFMEVSPLKKIYPFPQIRGDFFCHSNEHLSVQLKRILIPFLINIKKIKKNKKSGGQVFCQV